MYTFLGGYPPPSTASFLPFLSFLFLSSHCPRTRYAFSRLGICNQFPRPLKALLISIKCVTYRIVPPPNSTDTRASSTERTGVMCGPALLVRKEKSKTRIVSLDIRTCGKSPERRNLSSSRQTNTLHEAAPLPVTKIGHRKEKEGKTRRRRRRPQMLPRVVSFLSCLQTDCSCHRIHL